MKAKQVQSPRAKWLAGFAESAEADAYLTSMRRLWRSRRRVKRTHQRCFDDAFWRFFATRRAGDRSRPAATGFRASRAGDGPRITPSPSTRTTRSIVPSVGLPCVHDSSSDTLDGLVPAARASCVCVHCRARRAFVIATAIAARVRSRSAASRPAAVSGPSRSSGSRTFRVLDRRVMIGEQRSGQRSCSIRG